MTRLRAALYSIVFRTALQQTVPRFVNSALLAVLFLACATFAQAQAAPTGSIAFEAQAGGTGGRPEPVRQLTFYLLSKSFADIQMEAEETEGKPDMDRFIDSLEVSKELKAWMKKQRSVELSGEDFLRRLKPDDVLGVPEFHDAYVKRNSGYYAMGFPSPKYKESDKQKNPAKYEKQKQEYQESLRKYLTNNPQSTEGIEANLESINPQRRWAQQQAELQRRVRRRTVELSQGQYLTAKTDTDLEGRGMFAGLAPGEYWISTLDIEAVAGDARLRWDAPVTVRSGETIRIELSILNASEHRRPAQ